MYEYEYLLLAVNNVNIKYEYEYLLLTVNNMNTKCEYQIRCK